MKNKMMLTAFFMVSLLSLNGFAGIYAPDKIMWEDLPQSYDSPLYLNDTKFYVHVADYTKFLKSENTKTFYSYLKISNHDLSLTREEEEDGIITAVYQQKGVEAYMPRKAQGYNGTLENVSVNTDTCVVLKTIKPHPQKILDSYGYWNPATKQLDYAIRKN